MDIFLTGATGLIGGEVLARLLSSGHSVHALVRKRSRSETLPDVKRRLLARLKQSPKYDGSHSRLHVVIGDVCQDPSTWVLGCRAEYNTIIHCACDTSFTREYSASHSNVLGMRSMLAFANYCDSDPLFVMFSTSYVNTSPHDCVIDEREVTSKDAACNGYIASKIQCEVLLRESRLRHLILRPSVVLSRGVDSRDYARSILWAVRVIAELGELPVDENTRMDVVPVDYVANATVGLVNAFADYRGSSLFHVDLGLAGASCWVN